MLGLEDLPHAARPDLVEDGVLAQDERLGLARLDLGSLERRQLVALDEFLNEFFDGRRMGLRRDEIFELALRNDAGLGQLLDDGFKVEGHRCGFRSPGSAPRL
ncbi:MAG TPA: hypothetical protein VHV55_03065 [Pirellulales bacterium]|nr:hypothetical protein [Pirellulales bacterium]